jgi:hypothetical protein
LLSAQVTSQCLSHPPACLRSGDPEQRRPPTSGLSAEVKSQGVV